MADETSTQTETTEAQTTDSGVVVDNAPTGGELAVGSWKYDDSTVGTGDKPEWFKDSKYQSVADQAKAYGELESRFGGFTGSPEEYTMNEGVEYDTDNPLFSKLQEIGKTANMSNDMFNDIIGMYNDVQEQQYADMQEIELEALGGNAEARMTNVNDWAKANIPDELKDTFIDNIRTANDVKLAEHLMGLTKEQPVASPNTAPAQTATTKEELDKMQFEEDRYGNRRLSVDPEFRAVFDKKMAEYYNK